MNEEKAKILVIVEGAKTDVRLMEHLLNVYGIDEKHMIVSYNTNIYSLYNEMFKEVDPENIAMVEAFYHMKSIPDEDYDSYRVLMDELKKKTYKKRVNYENRNHDYSKFAVNKTECGIVIRQNIYKSWRLCGVQRSFNYMDTELPDSNEILHNQLLKMKLEDSLSVLCTCVFYVVDYNTKLIL